MFHDEHLERLTEGQGMVKDLTAAEMKALTIRKSADHVQTLAELLAQVKGQVPLVIELKSHWDGDERLAARALDGAEGLSRALLPHVLRPGRDRGGAPHVARHDPRHRGRARPSIPITTRCP